MTRRVLQLMFFLTMALGAGAARAQAPVVTFDTPTDGSIVQAEACAFSGTCDAKVGVQVRVSAAAALSTVDLAYRPIRRDWFWESNLCGDYDPVESVDARCGSATSLALPKTIWLNEGETHELIVTAKDVSGQVGTARVTVSVLPPNLPQVAAITLETMDPAAAEFIPPLRDPDSDPPTSRFLSGDIVTLFGDNLDRLAALNDGSNVFLEAYLSPLVGEYDEQYLASGGLPTAEWCKHKAEIVDYGRDASRGSFIKVRVPAVPDEVKVDCRYGATLTRERSRVFWRWLVRDRFYRTERVHEYLALPDPYLPRASRTPAFRIHDAPYPHLYGFGFINKPSATSYAEYLAVYGSNAYFCLGAYCVEDPFYWIYWPAYRAVVDGSDGSCVGMAATSLLMRQGHLDPRQFDDSVLYPAGFVAQDYKAKFTPNSDLPQPLNLWAEIRRNHGVQTSAEFIGRFLGQVLGSPQERYIEIGQNPLGYVTSMWTTSRGHAVTPYAIGGGQIAIYDNNYLTVPKAIPVDPASGGVEYDGIRYRGLANFPVSLWREGRHIPIDVIGNSYNLVFGSADPRYETAEGRWGWDANGDFAETLPGAVPVPPLGAAGASRVIPVLIPDAQAFDVQLNVRGGAYTYHGARGGSLVQLRVADAVDGQTDKVSIGPGTAPGDVGFSAGSSPRTLTAVLGLAAVERERVVFALSKLRAPAGGQLGFLADATARSVRYTNASAEPTRHVLIVSAVDGPSGSTSSRSFGPFEVPAGAVHTAAIADWPTASRIAWQIDLDGDGTVDRRGVSQGSDCPAGDHDTDGLPDACQALAAGEPAGQGASSDGCGCSNAGGAPSPWSAVIAVLIGLVAVGRRRRGARVGGRLCGVAPVLVALIAAGCSGSDAMSRPDGGDGADAADAGDAGRARGIVFVSEREGDSEVYVMNPDGTNQVRLTNNTANDYWPCWARDGSKIAFNSDRDGNTEIYVMDADGTNQVRLTNGATTDYKPSSSPDGSKFAFTSNRDGDTEIYVMNANGTLQANATKRADSSEDDPSWSPDGSKIVFTSTRGNGHLDIHVMNADGSNQVNVTNDPDFNDVYPSWSPDGTKIAFATNRDGNLEIYVMNANGTLQANATNAPDSRESTPSWSPDGSRILFVSDRDGPDQIYAMKADGTDIVRLTSGTRDNHSPFWY